MWVCGEQINNNSNNKSPTVWIDTCWATPSSIAKCVLWKKLIYTFFSLDVRISNRKQKLISIVFDYLLILYLNIMKNYMRLHNLFEWVSCAHTCLWHKNHVGDSVANKRQKIVHSICVFRQKLSHLTKIWIQLCVY